MDKQNKKGNRYKENTKKKVKTNKNLIPNIILIFFIILFVFSGFKIIMWFLNNRENKKIAEEISQAITIDEENVEEKEKYKVDFQALKDKNSDTVGFLKVNGTNIEYTVVKGTNNSYYLKHNFNKESNSAGWIFADYKNKVDGTDKNLVIYGHNMRDDSMFGSLKNILNDDWHNEEENKYVTFITENDNSIYEVFSVYQVADEDYYITTDFKDNEFNDFIKTIKSRSKFDFGVDVNENDNILTLSTCANNNKYRVVLHAKKIIE
ncbi:MAG: class B sortase [Clostridia bacterium]